MMRAKPSPRQRGRRKERAAIALVCALVPMLLAACTPDTPSPTPTPPPPAAASYHLDCGATANGTGSVTSPWNSLDAVTAHHAFLPGEQLLLKRGSVCFGRLTPAGSGTNGDPIVLGAYGTGAAPVVHGGGTPDQTGTVQLTDQHDWVVQDLDVTNLDPAGPDNTMRAGVLVANDTGGVLRGIVLRRLLVRAVTSSPGSSSADPHSYGGIAVVVRGAAKLGDGAFDGLRIEDDVVDHVGRSGITVWSDGPGPPRVTNTSITGNTVRYAEGDSIVVWGLDGAVIDHNTSEHGGSLPACPRCSSTALNTANAGIWPVASTHVLVRYNEVWGEGADGGDGQGFDIDDLTTDVVLEGNYAHDNAGGGLLICGAQDAVVRYNVFEHDAQGEIGFSCPEQRAGVRILNNVIAVRPGAGVAVVRRTNTRGSSPVLFANNIVLDPSGGGYDWPSPVEATHNVFVGAASPSRPADADAFTGDPALEQPGAGASGLDAALVYRPRSGSPVLASGADVDDDGVTDYAGQPLTQGTPDRGALTLTTRALPDVRGRVSATRQAADVALSWSGTGADAWRVLRSVAGGPFEPVTGQLRSTTWLDVAAPSGRLRYRVQAVDREGTRPIGDVAAG